MTRPRKATVDYFPHACNHGKTMFILEDQWGNDGYAFWFKLLELLGTSEGHVYDAGNPAAWRFLVAKTRVNSETAADILQCLAELEAIDPELWSEKLIWVENFVDGIRDVYKKRVEDIPIRPDIRHRKPASNGISGGENPQSKVKESKVKDIYPQSKNDTSSSPKKPTKTKSIKTPLPPDFSISDKVRNWAAKNGHTNIEQHLESFINKCKAKGYQYVDWDSAFMEAIRENWGKIPQGNGRASPGNGNYSVLTTEENQFWQKYKNECYFGDESLSKEKARIREKLKQAGGFK